jgi:hypothetical protein
MRVARFLRNFLAYIEDEGLELVTPLPAGTSFFRGRLTGDTTSIPPTAKDLGSAPRRKATANRMSPAGISYFYASGDPQTAVAEIAAHGVEPLAIIGRFTSTSELTVLDLTKPPKPPSPFDKKRRDELRMVAFLREFIERVTVPVIPDGREHIDYAPTQVLTDYLRWVPTRQIRGIVLPSRQTGRPTYVMFFGPDAFEQPEDNLPEFEPEASLALHDSALETEMPSFSVSILEFTEEIPHTPTFILRPEDVVFYEIDRSYLGRPKA